MAPEQIEGGDITPAVDIYALGVVMYEMVTGRRPYSGGNTLASVVRRLQSPPEPPTRYVPDLDPRWTRPSCAAWRARRKIASPARRRFLTHSLIIRARRSAAPSPAVPALGAGGSGRLSAAVAVEEWFRLRGRGPALESVAILPFANRTNDSSLEFWAAGLDDALINNLAQLPQLKVISRGSTLQYKRQSDPVAFARRLRVGALVTAR